MSKRHIVTGVRMTLRNKASITWGAVTHKMDVYRGGVGWNQGWPVHPKGSLSK